MDKIFIPPKTAEKLNGTFALGTRHQAKIDIALPLLGGGLSATAVEQTLIEKFPDASLSEIQGVIRWCHERATPPTGRMPIKYEPPKANQPKKTPQQQCDWWMGEAKTTPEQIIESSPIKFKGTIAEETILFFEQFYRPTDKLNIVCKYTLAKDGKANPSGEGKTDTRDNWIEYFKKNGVPKSEAGAWLRMNPTKEGSGFEGAITDADVTSWRFVLLESDAVCIETQLALFQRLKLPIAAILMSGGKSAHAWLRVDCETEEKYRATAKTVLDILEPFGIDQANKNPSRLSRLPGAHRTIRAVGDGMQQLLFLNSAAPALTGDDIEQLQNRISIPINEDRPMRRLILDSIPRYEELFNNRGKLGVQIGFDEFDADTGGFKPGQVTVIAAGTNQGKSTVALNFLNGALAANHGVALFTLEMDREEIIDLLISNNCRVNRNCFNTGYFQNGDVEKIAAQASLLCKLPLWIFDDASMTVGSISDRVKALKIENKIGLVVVDYVQIITPDNAMLPREQQVAEIARGLRILAKQTKLPFIVLSQLNDEGKLRESRVVAHEAHNVIILEPNDEQTLILMRVVKGRRIRKKNYELRYEPEFARVFSSKVSPEDVPQSYVN